MMNNPKRNYIGGYKKDQNLPRCPCGALLQEDNGFGIGFTGDEIPFTSESKVLKAGGRHYICPESRGGRCNNPRETIIMPDGSVYKFRSHWKKWPFTL